MPDWLLILLLFAVAAVVGAAWTIVPALLKARYGVNEIITTLMMTFIGINLANILVKGPFQDLASNVPQTRAIAFTNLLPTIPGTRIHVGVLVAFVAAIVAWFLMTRTSFGLRLAVLGANARAAAHVGISVPRLIVVSFAVSGVFVGLAAATEILGIWGYVRADWNPAFGLLVVPLVFLARLQRDRGHPLRRVPRAPVDRRRLRGPGGRRLERVHAAARRPDPALHGRDRVARAAPGARRELPAARSAAGQGQRMSELS